MNLFRFAADNSRALHAAQMAHDNADDSTFLRALGYEDEEETEPAEEPDMPGDDTDLSAEEYEAEVYHGE
jgi:hypothetical protein